MMDLFEGFVGPWLVLGLFIAIIGFVDVRRGPRPPGKLPWPVRKGQPWLTAAEFEERQYESSKKLMIFGIAVFVFSFFILLVRIVTEVFAAPSR